ncbi:MAG: MFS transporter [Bryobacteraceae bacterium]
MATSDYSAREQWGWYLYDWANSAFSSTVVTLFLGPYLTVLAKAAAGADGYVYPFGLKVDPRSYWGYLISLSVASQVVVLPVLGAIADFGRRKKQLLALFTYLGAFTTMAMFFTQGTGYLLGGALFLVANLCFGAAIVMSNAFLPDIAPPEDRDAVSSKGWGLGYAGGGTLLALNLLLFAKHETFGLTEAMAVRLSLASAGVWWGGFALITMARLQNRGPARHLPPGTTIWTVGFHQLSETIRGIRHYPQTVLFLLAYLVYNDAIQTVITLSGQFGADELKMPMSQLTLAILMVQFVAFGGAFAFNWLAARIGAKKSIMIALFIWTLTLAYIFLLLRTPGQFFGMAAVVALVMGGSQALSRSLYSQMIPKGKEAEYFSIYEISDKGTSWLGPLVFAIALQWTGSYRSAILSLVIFFITGLFLLARVDVRRAAAEAGNNPL